MRSRALVAPTLLVVLAFASPARADKTRECVDAYEKAQVERKDGHLVTAREQLLICAQDACPAVIKKDCVPWLSEVEQSVPTVVVFAKDANGKDLADVKVTLDGVLFSNSIDGVARPIDPGKHVFKFEDKNGKTKEETFVIAEGQKRRAVGVSFEADKGVTPPPPVEGPKPEEPDKPSKLPAYGLTALGLAGIGTGIFFGVTAKTDADDLRGSCAPRCHDDEISKVETKLLLSDIFLGVGIIALGVAAYMFIRSPSPSASARFIGPGAMGGSF